VLAACSLGAPYFEPGTSTTMTRAPGGLGETIVIGTTSLAAKPGDEVMLIDAVPLDTTGEAEVVPWVLTSQEFGRVGAWSMDEPFPGAEPRTLRDLLQPLPDFVLTPEHGSVEVDIAVTLDSPGTFSWMAVKVTYRVAGFQRSQTWYSGGAVCAGDPRPTSCEAME
jgi:hypothetical protein